MLRRYRHIPKIQRQIGTHEGILKKTHSTALYSLGFKINDFAVDCWAGLVVEYNSKSILFTFSTKAFVQKTLPELKNIQTLFFSDSINSMGTRHEIP